MSSIAQNFRALFISHEKVKREFWCHKTFLLVLALTPITEEIIKKPYADRLRPGHPLLQHHVNKRTVHTQTSFARTFNGCCDNSESIYWVSW